MYKLIMSLIFMFYNIDYYSDCQRLILNLKWMKRNEVY